MPESLTISFDLDGVVIQNPFSRGVFPWVRRHVWEHTKELRGLDSRDAGQRMTEAVNRIWMARMQQGEFVAAYDWDDILNEASRGLGGPEIPDVAGLVERFCGEEGMIAVLPGAREGLELLRANGVTMHALTNGFHRYQWPVLVALGIEHYFDTVFTPDRIGYAKPQAGAFHAVDGLAAHVGDTLVHDIVGANMAGLTSVWMNPGLPSELAPYSPAERASAPLLRTFLEQQLEGNMYTRFHPEANVDNATPDLAVLDVHEAAQALLERLQG